MGDRKRPVGRMAYDATLGGMLNSGARVSSRCKACDRMIPLDVERACRIVGPDASLWDFFLPCLFDDCPDVLTAFHCSTGPSTPFRPLQTYDVFRTLDKMGWDITPKWPHQPPYSYGISMR